MKKFWIFSLLLICVPLKVFSYSGIRDVTVFEDDGSPELYGSLRRVLEGACLEEGDDVIVFHHTTLPEIRIILREPLVIPSTCNGSVTIRGSNEVETILDGSLIRSGNAILIIESWGDTIEHLTFTGFGNGAGIYLKDGDHTIRDNFIGVLRNQDRSAANQKGIWVKGDWNKIENNTISANTQEGILLEGSANLLLGNNIGYREGSCPNPALPTPSATFWPTFIHEVIHENLIRMPDTEVPIAAPLCGNGGPGIRIQGSRNVIGNFSSPNFTFDPSNKILFNRDRGIVVEAQGTRNAFVHNSIAYNRGAGIDLEGTANAGILPVENLQIFPPETEERTPHYNITGRAVPGSTLDLYVVARNDPDDSEGKGEGAKYLTSLEIFDEIFTFDFENSELAPGMQVTAITCDRAVNCSEFSARAIVSLDSDQDAIPDWVEDPNGDTRIDRGEMDPYLIDSDGDGLPDSAEDRNGNGRVDAEETDPRKADSDTDGISDFVETGGDGLMDTSEGDTNPLNPDTDGDSRPDGVEDANHDGLMELGETDPRG